MHIFFFFFLRIKIRFHKLIEKYFSFHHGTALLNLRLFCSYFFFCFPCLPFFIYCGGSNSYSSFLYRSNFESRKNHGCQIVGNPRITLKTEKLQVKRTNVNFHTEKLNCTLQIMYLGILLNQEEK